MSDGITNMKQYA